MRKKCGRFLALLLSVSMAATNLDPYTIRALAAENTQDIVAEEGILAEEVLDSAAALNGVEETPKGSEGTGQEGTGGDTDTGQEETGGDAGTGQEETGGDAGTGQEGTGRDADTGQEVSGGDVSGNEPDEEKYPLKVASVNVEEGSYKVTFETQLTSDSSTFRGSVSILYSEKEGADFQDGKNIFSEEEFDTAFPDYSEGNGAFQEDYAGYVDSYGWTESEGVYQATISSSLKVSPDTRYTYRLFVDVYDEEAKEYKFYFLTRSATFQTKASDLKAPVEMTVVSEKPGSYAAEVETKLTTDEHDPAYLYILYSKEGASYFKDASAALTWSEFDALAASVKEDGAGGQEKIFGKDH